MAMMAMTTSNSISVNADRHVAGLHLLVIIITFPLVGASE
jgi:hypothetical protein